MHVWRRSGNGFVQAHSGTGLEGVIAKKKDSLYFKGKRTKSWLKMKHLIDYDFVVCWYVDKGNHMTSIVLGQYREKKLMYKKHVALSVNNEAFAEIKTQPPRATAPFVGNVPANHGNGMRRANEKTVTGLTPSPA